MGAPPSPLKPGVPLPATVLIVPWVSISRTLWLAVSPMKTAPSAVMVTPSGAFSWAAVGGPPSPAAPGAPVPATLVIVPVASTRRMRLSPVSAMR